MFNLLIVDDEIEILEGLQEMFLYDFPEELEVYTAVSGKKALAVLDKVKCDVVLTDIKMPGMNGMELYQHIRENWPRAKVVFLTGFRDHEVLYEVIQNKEIRYLLKTEEDQKIKDTVLDALTEIRREKEEFRLEEYRSELFKKAKYWLQKEFLERIIFGKMEQETDQDILEELEIEIEGKNPFYLFVGRIDQKFPIIEMDVLEKMILIIRQTMPRILKIHICVLEHCYVSLMIQPRLIDDYTDWNRIFYISSGALEEIQSIFMTQLQIKVPFAISKKEILFGQLREQYYFLKENLSTIIQEEEPGILTVNEKEKVGRQMDNKAALMKLPLLNSYLEQGKKHEFQAVLKEITAPLLSGASKHDIGALELYYNVAMVFLRYINMNEFGEKLPFHIALYKLTNAEDFYDWNEADCYLKQLTELLFQIKTENSGYYRDEVVLRVEEYIRSHLNSDLSLTALADIGGFNASYLSRIFKQKNHCNLSEYIVNERIKAAKRLLLETNEKINRIGEEVGYFTPHSFTRVFKNSEGISPVEFRIRYKK